MAYVATVRGGMVNLLATQFVSNFVGDDQKCYTIEIGIVTRFDSISLQVQQW